MDTLRRELTALLNFHSAERGSDTPDYVLADYLLDCLKAFDRATVQRDKHAGCEGAAPLVESTVTRNCELGRPPRWNDSPPEPQKSDTPRTDAAQLEGNIKNQSDSDKNWPFDAIKRGYDFARELERELNKARIPICVGRPIIEILAREGMWTSENGNSVVAADCLFQKNPYASEGPAPEAATMTIYESNP